MKDIKKKILKVLAIIWTVIVPFIVGGGFAVGCFMSMWKVLMWPLWLCIILGILITVGCIFGVGKMIGKW